MKVQSFHSVKSGTKIYESTRDSMTCIFFLEMGSSRNYICHLSKV